MYYYITVVECSGKWWLFIYICLMLYLYNADVAKKMSYSDTQVLAIM